MGHRLALQRAQIQIGKGVPFESDVQMYILYYYKKFQRNFQLIGSDVRRQK